MSVTSRVFHALYVQLKHVENCLDCPWWYDSPNLYIPNNYIVGDLALKYTLWDTLVMESPDWQLSLILHDMKQTLS